MVELEKAILGFAFNLISPHLKWQGHRYLPTAFCSFPVNHMQAIHWHFYFTSACLWFLGPRLLTAYTALDTWFPRIPFGCWRDFVSSVPLFVLFAFQKYLDNKCIVRDTTNTFEVSF